MQPEKRVNRLRTPSQTDNRQADDRPPENRPVENRPASSMPPPNRPSSGRPASGAPLRPAKTGRPTSSQSATSKAIRQGWAQVRTYVRQHPWLGIAYMLISRAALIFILASTAWVVILKYVPVWFTPLTISRKWDTVGTDKSSTIFKTWRPYEEINREAALAVVASEDQQFPYHWGFDFDEIQDAIKESQYRKRARGASTISQQVAKNVFLWNGRSYIRKGLEVYFTVMIELIWGKKRILEVYLNVAETGPMTFGMEAAAERFYSHSANSLSREEAARIAAVLPNPNQFSVKRPSSYVQRRTRQIARQMRALGGQKYIRNL